MQSSWALTGQRYIHYLNYMHFFLPYCCLCLLLRFFKSDSGGVPQQGRIAPIWRPPRQMGDYSQYPGCGQGAGEPPRLVHSACSSGDFSATTGMHVTLTPLWLLHQGENKELLSRTPKEVSTSAPAKAKNWFSQKSQAFLQQTLAFVLYNTVFLYLNYMQS